MSPEIQNCRPNTKAEEEQRVGDANGNPRVRFTGWFLRLPEHGDERGGGRSVDDGGCGVWEEEGFVDDGWHHSIYSIEIWVGLRKCDSIQFAENEPCEWMKITDEKPMVVELVFDDDENNRDEDDVNVSPEETKKIFTDDGRLAYTWDNVQMYKNKNKEGSSGSSSSKNRKITHKQRVIKGVRISLPGKQRQLSVQEVKIWARIEEEQNSKRACMKTTK